MTVHTFFPLALSLALAVLSIGSLAHAHGDKAHDSPSTTLKKEQKEQKDWGMAGDAKDVVRTIDIQMDDRMRFTPDRVAVRRGQTVRFRLANNGKVLHEMVLGTAPVLAEHAALMKRFPNMEHDEPYMAHVPPGKTGEIVWTFNRAGAFDFACLIAGHFEAGMVGKIMVD